MFILNFILSLFGETESQVIWDGMWPTVRPIN